VGAAPPAIALTVGEPAGIGPEISIRAAWAPPSGQLRAAGRRRLLAMLAADIDPAIRVSRCPAGGAQRGLPHFGPDR
jgi:4-hydroxythreonine-4-phosphate dehydrogenase